MRLVFRVPPQMATISFWLPFTLNQKRVPQKGRATHASTSGKGQLVECKATLRYATLSLMPFLRRSQDQLRRHMSD